jgi:hypothetical protein
VCHKHGGGAPQVRRAAARRLALARAAADLALLGDDVADLADPLGALARLGGQAMARLRAAGERAVALGGGCDVLTPEARAAVEAVDQLWRDAVRVAAMMARLGVDERLVELYAQADQLLAAQIHRAVAAALAELGHDPDDPAVAAVVGRHLAVIGG